ncbi:MAG: recombinase family protein [Nocardioides sp.]
MSELVQAAPMGIRPMAVIYLRVSTKDQAGRGGEAEGFSIPAQRDACLRKAEALGAVVVGEFVDAGESARSANRPELQKMLTFVKEHKVAHVIVHKIDRLARNRIDDVEINLQLTASGAQLVSCSENIDETPSGMLLHGIMSSIAEFYSRNLATESKKGLRQKAKAGGTPGKAPFGYLNTRERLDNGREVRTVILDPDRAQWVPWIFERYATGEWTVAMLREELEKQGVTTVQRPNQPARPLANSHLYAILGNRYYVGKVSFEGIEYDGKHQPLITEALFADIQRVRQARHQSREKPRVHTHYLKGSVFCGGCGEPLTFEQSRNAKGTLYDYFYCLGRQRLKNGCEFRAIQAGHLEELVADYWATVSLNPTRIQEIREVVLAHIQIVMPKESAERRQARDRLAELEQESQKLLDAFYADALDTRDLKREQARIAGQRAVCESTLSKHDVTEDILRGKLDGCLDLLGSAQSQYLASAEYPQLRRDLNQGVFAKLFVDDDEIVGSDLTPAYQRLMTDDLATDLARERKREETGRVRTSDLYIVPPVTEVTELAQRGQRQTNHDLPGKAVRDAVDPRFGRFLRLERPRGALPWEKERTPAPEDRSSNELLLVAGAGFEPATSGL